MYAEVYKWFTDISGLGLTEQAGLFMNPKPAAQEEDIAGAIEVWEEKVNVGCLRLSNMLPSSKCL